MKLKYKIKEKIGRYINFSSQIIGDILLLKFQNNISEREKKKISIIIKEMMPRIKTICEIKSIEGEYRKPKINKIYGKGTETIHKEHGIFYKIDVSKTMFSKGNLYERQRIISKVKTYETIVDMFAGIGYFSLGIAKFSKPKKIYGIEKNPTAFRLLKENISLNNVENIIIPILGDCKDISKKRKYQNIADRVIMGFIKNTESFLPFAFSFLKGEGIIHYHNIHKKEELWEKPIKAISRCAKESGYEVERILEKRKVKSYAPKIFHIVMDVKVKKIR